MTNELINENRPLNFNHFLYGFYIYNFAFICIFIGFPIVMVRGVQLLAFVYMLKYFFVKSRVKVGFFGYSMFVTFILWNIILIFRGGFSSLQNFQRCLFNFDFLLYLSPLIFYKFSRLKNIKYLYHIIHVLNVSYLVLMLIFIGFILKDDANGESINLFETFNMLLGGGAIFFIFNKEYVKKNEYITAHIVCIVSLLIGAILARRAIIISYLMAYFIFSLFRIKFFVKRGRKTIQFVITIILFPILIWSNLAFLGSSFTKLSSRIADNTRTKFDLELLDEMSSKNNMIFGRGISGEYYSQSFENNVNNMRSGIETGFLNLLLKGGCILIILFCLFFIPSLFLGLFRSKNLLSKIFSIYGLMFIIDFSIASSNYNFNIRYFVMLFGTFLNYSPQFRNLSNKYIRNFLSDKYERRI